MAYDFTTTGDGNIQVAQGGQNVATVTPGLAASQYGYVAPVSTKQAAVSSPSVISSATGADIVQQQAAKLSTIAAGPTQPATQYNYVNGKAVPVDTTQVDTTKPTGGASGGADTTAPAPTKITLINPNTEQTVTFENADLNKANIQGYMNSGYQVSDASGTIPDWLTPAGVTTTQTPADKAQADVDAAAADLKTLTDNLTKYTISDADLKAQTDAITAQWDAREADMQKINSSRASAINTLGIRLGSRYSGGSGGTFGGIVSEEERQGVVRIGDLEAQKQAAIAAAKQAALTQNWSVYSKQVDLAEQAYSDKISALKDLNAATVAQNKAVADQAKQAQDEADKQQEDYYNQVIKPINDIVADAAKNGATQEVQDAISAELDKPNPDVASAIAAAGNYLQTATGEVGDFLATNRYLASVGQKQLTLAQYQQQSDARKANIAAAGRAAPTATAAQVVYGNYAPRLETADATIKSLTPTISALPTSGFLLQQKLPSFMQSSDLQVYNQAKTNFINAVLRQESGAAISDSERTSYDAQYFPQPGDSQQVIDAKAQNRAQVVSSYRADAGSAYAPPVAVTATNNEDAAKQIIIDYGSKNPDQQAHIQEMAKTMSYSDIKQVLGI